MPTGITALIILLIFIMPGFAWQRFYSSFVPHRFAGGQHLVLECLTRSAIVHALCFPVPIYAYLERWDRSSPTKLVIWGVVILLVVPLIMGVFSAFVLRSRYARKLVEKIGLRYVYPIPTAWDWLFWNLSGNTVALVTLKNGNKIAGGFGPNSFVGDSHHDRDVFLESVMEMDATGKVIREIERTDGAWIASSEIAVIELLKPLGGKDVERLKSESGASAASAANKDEQRAG